MFYVYILQSEITKQYYKGQADDLHRRIKEHNNREEKSTAPFCPWVLVWHTTVETRSQAVVLERKLKNMTSREKTIDFINRHSKK
jgi:putative endonuclease